MIIIITHADWLTEWMKNTLSAGMLYACKGAHHRDSMVHTPSSSVRERERVSEKEGERERER